MPRARQVDPDLGLDTAVAAAISAAPSNLHLMVDIPESLCKDVNPMKPPIARAAQPGAERKRFNELNCKGMMMFGQRTAGWRIYIGCQGIVRPVPPDE